MMIGESEEWRRSRKVGDLVEVYFRGRGRVAVTRTKVLAVQKLRLILESGHKFTLETGAISPYPKSAWTPRPEILRTDNPLVLAARLDVRLVKLRQKLATASEECEDPKKLASALATLEGESKVRS
jgi:hypothetical protein